MSDADDDLPEIKARIGALRCEGGPHSPTGGLLRRLADEFELLRAERDALREYYEAVQMHPVNYSAGNIERVKSAIAAIKKIDAALGGEGKDGNAA